MLSWKESSVWTDTEAADSSCLRFSRLSNMFFLILSASFLLRAAETADSFFNSSSPSIVVVPPLINAGEAFQITVQDSNLSASPLELRLASVVLLRQFRLVPDPEVYLLLIETGLSSNIFTGLVRTGNSTCVSSMLAVADLLAQPGWTIRILYLNQTDNRAVLASAAVDIRPQAVVTVPDFIAIGEPLSVRVLAPNLVNPSLARAAVTVQVTVARARAPGPAGALAVAPNATGFCVRGRFDLSPAACPSGRISLSAAEYVNGLDLLWRISPPGAAAVAVTVAALDTEEGWDFLSIASCGAGAGAAGAAPCAVRDARSGAPPPYSVGSDPADGGGLAVRFTSDSTVTAGGFDLSWTSLPPPAQPGAAPRALGLLETRPGSGVFEGALPTADATGGAGSGAGALLLRGPAPPWEADVVTVAYLEEPISQQGPAPAGGAWRTGAARACHRGRLTLSSAVVPATGGVLGVTLVDADIGPGANASVLITPSQAAAAPVWITLGPAAPPAGPGVFVGSLSVACGGGPAGLAAGCAGDLLTAAYPDAAPPEAARAFARVAVNGTIAVGPYLAGHSPALDGAALATVVAGGDLTVTVVDIDLDRDPSAADGASVSVTGAVAGSGRLSETGPSTGVFTGSIPVPSPAPAGGPLFTATYSDTCSGGAVVARTALGRVASAGIVSLWASGGPAGFAAGDALSVTVVDPDLNQLPAVVEAAQALGRAAGGGCAGCSAVVELRETGPSSSVFTGLLRTTAGPVAGSPPNGSLVLPAPGVIVEALYSDAAPLSVAMARMKTCSRGNVTLSPAMASAGGAAHATALLTVTVVDSDLNTDSTVRERSTVMVTSGVDSAAVSLSEAGWDSAVFTAVFAAAVILPVNQGVAASATAAATLSVSVNGSIVSAFYTDVCPLGSVASSASSRIGPGGTLAATPSPLMIGQSLTVSVIDPFLNLDGSQAESYTSLVRIIVDYPQQSVQLQVTETGQNSSLFTGVVSTSGFGAITLSDTGYSIRNRITVTFIDPIPSLPAKVQVVEIMGSASVALFQLGVDTGRFAIGQPLTISVCDRDFYYTSPPNSQVIAVLNQTSRTNILLVKDTETIRLNPVIGWPLPTMCFTGTIPTSDALGLPENGVLDSLSAGNLVTCYYAKLGFSLASSTIQAGYDGRISFVFQSTHLENSIEVNNPPGYGAINVGTYVSGNVSVTVTDPGLNQNASFAEIRTDVLTYRRYSSTTFLWVLLVETGPSSANFTGSIVFKSVTRTSATCSNVVNSGCVVDPLIGSSGVQAASDPRALLVYQQPVYQIGRTRSGVNSVQMFLAPGSDATSPQWSPNPFIAGSILLVTVSDSDQNLDRGAIDTIMITVKKQSARPGELCCVVVWCNETDFNSGIFTGAMRTFLDSALGNNIVTMNLLDGDILTVEYVDMYRHALDASNQGIVSVILDALDDVRVYGWYTCRGGKYQGLSCGGEADSTTCSDGSCNSSVGIISASPLVVGGGLTISLSEPDCVYNFFADGIEASLINPAADDKESIRLQQASAPCLFTGTFPTAWTDFLGVTENDGVLSVNENDTVIIQYLDSTPIVTASISINVIGAQSAAVIISPSAVQLGENVLITLYDHDLDYGLGSPKISVVSGQNNLTVLLNESGTFSGKFTASIQSSQSKQAMSGVLSGIEPGMTILASYLDMTPIPNVIQSGAGSFVTSTKIIISEVKLYGEGFIIVLDDTVDAVQVTVSVYVLQTNGIANITSIVYSIVVSLKLQSHGMYVGQIIAGTALPPADLVGNVTILRNISAGSGILVRYEQPLPGISIENSTTVQASHIGAIYAEKNEILAGTGILLTVLDEDLNSNPSLIEGAVSTAWCGVKHDSNITLQMVETAPDSSKFTGWLKTQSTSMGSPLSLGYGILQVSAHTPIIVQYRDMAPVGISNVSIIVLQDIVGQLSIIPEALKIGASFAVIVDDFDLNVDNDTLQTTSVEIRRSSPKAEYYSSSIVILQETNTDSGTFSSVINAESLGVLNGDKLVIVYNDSEPEQAVFHTLQVVPSHVGIIQARSRIEIANCTNPRFTEKLISSLGSMEFNISTIFAGSAVYITVEDEDLNSNPQKIENTTVTCMSSLLSCGVSVQMIETEISSAIFTGLLHTRYSSLTGSSQLSADSLFVLDVNFGDIISCIYYDMAPLGQRYTSDAFRIATNGSITVNPSVAISGSDIHITVVDHDLNTDNFKIETASVQASSSQSEQSLQLLETGLGSGVFTGVLITRDDIARGVGDIGVMSSRAGDIISISYLDKCPSNMIARVSISITSSICGCGEVSVTPTYAALGTVIQVNVSDPDANLSPTLIDSVIVRAKNIGKRGQDELSVDLFETGPNTGKFTGWVIAQNIDSNPSATNVNNRLCYSIGADAGDDLMVTYSMAASDKTMTKAATVHILNQASLSISPAPIRPGEKAFIQVVDRFTLMRSVVVTLSSSSKAEPQKVLRLIESRNKGEFTGILHTVNQTGPGRLDELDSMHVSGGDILSADYMPVDSFPAAANITISVIVSTYGRILLSPIPFREDGEVFITVVDADCNLNADLVESVPVLVNTQAVSKPLTLYETSVSSTSFTGSILLSSSGIAPRVLSPLASSATVFGPVRFKEIITFMYTDRIPDSIISKNEEVLDSALAQFRVSRVCLGGGYISVNIYDADLVDRISSSVDVHVKSFLGNDLLSIQLYEISPHSPNFTGIIVTELKDSSAYDNLFVLVGDIVQLTYLDMAPLQIVEFNVSVLQSYLGSIEVSQNSISAGESFFITVVDQDQKGTSNLLVYLSDTSNLVSEVSLVEMGTGTGSFTAKVETEEYYSCIFDAWGCSTNMKFITKLIVNEGDILTMKYYDTAPATAMSAQLRVCSTGTITASPLTAALGWNISVVVIDVDLSGDSISNISVMSDFGSTSIVLTSQAEERDRFTGYFNIGVDTVPAFINFSSISLEYVDACPKKHVITKIPLEPVGKLLFSTDVVYVGSLLKVSFIYNGIRPSKSISVLCTGSLQDRMTVALLDDGLQSGTFIGTISPGSENNISAVPGQTISCGYRDDVLPLWYSISANVHSSHVGIVQTSTRNLGEGALLTVTIIDSDLNSDSGVIEAHHGSLAAYSNSGEVSITIHETGVNSSIFTGLLVTSGADADFFPGTQKLYVNAGDSVIVKYTDEAPYAIHQLMITAKVSHAGTLSVANSPILVGSTTIVNVNDEDLNLDALNVEQSAVTVYVTSSAFSAVDSGICSNSGECFPDSTIVLLTEISQNSNYFTGTFQTVGVQVAKPQIGSVLNVKDGYQITLQYLDSSPFATRTLQVPVAQSHTGNVSVNSLSELGVPASVTVIDADLNVDPFTVDTGYVQVLSNKACPEGAIGCNPKVELQITETGLDNATFTGSITAFNASGTGTDSPCYFMICQPIFAEEGSTLEFNYLDAAPLGLRNAISAVAVTAKVSMGPIGVNGSIMITVIDPDYYSSSSSANIQRLNITVQINSSRILNRPSFQLQLTDSTPRAGIFTGMIQTSTLPAVSARYIFDAFGSPLLMDIQVGDIVSVNYIDFRPPGKYSALRPVTPSVRASLILTSSSQQQGTIVLAGSILFITVKDADMDFDSLNIDSTSVRIIFRSISEDIVIIESSLSSGVFTAALRLTTGAFSSSPALYQSLSVKQGDQFTVTYADISPTAVITQIIKIASSGIVNINPNPITSGMPVTVTVVDFDLDVNPNTISIGNVTLLNQDSSDVEILAITQSSLDSNIFVGTIPTSSILHVQRNTLTGLMEGSIVSAIYQDAIPQYLSFGCTTCYATAHVAVPGNISASPTMQNVNGNITITVQDKDLDINSSSPKSITVLAHQYFKFPESFKSVVLTETGNLTATFTGILRTSDQAIDGALLAGQGARILIQYWDEDPKPSTLRNATSRISSAGQVILGPSPLNPDTTLMVTIIDSDLDISDNIDSNTVASKVVVSCSNDPQAGHAVLVTETSVHSGIFTGYIGTQSIPALGTSLVTGAASGQYITATYTDVAPAALRQATVRVASVANISIQPSIIDQDAVITVIVFDPDLDSISDTIKNTSITLQSSALDSKTLILFETGIFSGVFTGIIPTASTPVQFQNMVLSGINVLYSPAAAIITAGYLDQNPTPSTLRQTSKRVSMRGILSAVFPTYIQISPAILSPLLITVVDFDLNYMSVSNFNNSIFNAAALESANVLMTGSGSNLTGFTGILQIQLVAVVPDTDSKILQVSGGNQIQVIYKDLQPLRYVPLVYRVPTIGTVSMNTFLVVGASSGALTITVSDADLLFGSCPGLQGYQCPVSQSSQTTVLVQCDADSEIVVLRKSPTQSVFYGFIKTAVYRNIANIGNQILEVRNGYSVSVKYSDANPISDLVQTLSPDYISFRGAISCNQTVIQPNSVISFTLIDYDLAIQPWNAIISLQCIQSAVLNYLMVPSATLGIFTGSVRTNTRLQHDFSAVQGCSAGRVLTITYIDVQKATFLCSFQNTPLTLYLQLAVPGSLLVSQTAKIATAGLPLLISLYDPDIDIDGNHQVVAVYLSKSGFPDSEVVMLHETGLSTGYFTGALETAVSRESSKGILNGCELGDLVTILYLDLNPYMNITYSITFQAQLGILYMNPKEVSPNQYLTITVVDYDRNTNAFTFEQYDALVTLYSTFEAQLDDVENITITEISRNSSTFTGSILLSSSESIGAFYDSSLHVTFRANGGSLVQGIYHNLLPKTLVLGSDCKSFGLSHSCNIAYSRTICNASMKIFPPFDFAYQGSIQIFVFDGNLNHDMFKVENASLTISKLNSQGYQLFTLAETNSDSGTFVANISISTLTFSLGVGDSIQVSYQDNASIPVQPIILRGGFSGILSTPNLLLPGGNLKVTLLDYDLNLLPGTPETVSNISVLSKRHGQVEWITLIEMGENLGIFTGFLQTKWDSSRGEDQSGWMYVAPGDFLEVEYMDQVPKAEILELVKISKQGIITRSPPLLWIGGNVTVTVEDFDLNQRSDAQDMAVNALSIKTDSESDRDAMSLNLFETGVSTGVFTSTFDILGTTPSPGSLSIGPIVSGEFLTVIYSESLPLEVVSLRLPVFTKGVISLSPRVWSEPYYLTVTVIDKDLDKDIDLVDKLEKGQVFVQIIGDRENVQMIESGTSTGIFTGVIPASTTSSLGNNINNGVLAPIRTEIHLITANYFDISPRLNLRCYSTIATNATLQTSPSIIPAGSLLRITIVDMDQNLDDTVYDSVQAIVSSDHEGEGIETITLIETQPSSGIFTNILATIRTKAISGKNDGIINIFPGTCRWECLKCRSSQQSCSSCNVGGCSGYLVAMYSEISPARTLQTFVAVGSAGSIDTCGNSYLKADYCIFPQTGTQWAGSGPYTSALSVTVVDPDRNIQPDTPDLINEGIVFIESPYDSPKTVPQFTETGLNTNVFTGSISLQLGGEKQSGVVRVFDRISYANASSILTLTYREPNKYPTNASGYPTANSRLTTIATLTSSPATSALSATDLMSAASLRVGSMLSITIVDGDMDWTSEIANALSVNICFMQCTTSSTSILLTENGPGTATFTGSILVRMGNVGLCDGSAVLVSPQSGANYVYLVYDELTPFTVSGRRLYWALVWPASLTLSPSLSPFMTYINDTISVSVTDYSVYSQQVNTNFLVSGMGYFFSRQVLLKASNFGGFTGVLKFNLSGANPTADTRLMLMSTYVDSTQTFSANDSVLIAPRGIINIQPFQDSISILSVTVTDASLDISDTLQSILANVTTSASSIRDLERLSLQETSAGSAVFTGCLQVMQSSSAAPYNSVLETGLFNFVTISYNEIIPPSTVSIQQQIICSGRIILPNFYAPGGQILIKVSDCDLGATNNNNVTVLVVGNLYSSYVVLTAETRNYSLLSAVYSANISSQNFTSHDPNPASRSGIITVFYNDSSPMSSISSSTSEWTTASVIIQQSFNGRQSTSRLQIGELFNISVVDLDAISGTDGSKRVRVYTSQDSEFVVLRNTGSRNGTFTGLMYTDKFAKAVVGDGRISPAYSGLVITVTYFDQFPEMNISKTVTVSDFGQVLLEEPIEPLDDARISMLVVDADLNTNALSPQTYHGLAQINHCSSDFCDSEKVVLSEVGLNSTSFTGELLVTTKYSIVGDGYLFLACSGLESCFVHALYNHSTWGVFSCSSPTLHIAEISIVSTPGAPGGSTFFVTGENVSVTLIDADLNKNQSALENVSLSVHFGVITQPLVIIETAPNSSTFQGIFATKHLATLIPPGTNVSVLYNNLFAPVYTVSATITAIDKAILTSDPEAVSHLWYGSFSAIQQVRIVVNDLAGWDLVQQRNISAAIYIYNAQVSKNFTLQMRRDDNNAGRFVCNLSISTSFSNPSTLYFTNTTSYKYKVIYDQPGTSTASHPTLFRRLARDGILVVPTQMHSGELLSITIIDGDRDLNWEEIDFIFVRIISNKLHEGSEYLQLTETSVTADNAQFTGTVITRNNPHAGAENDGVVNTVENNVLTISYDDPQGSNGAQISVSRQIFVKSTGIMGSIFLLSQDTFLSLLSANDIQIAAAMIIDEGKPLFIVVNDTDDESVVRQGRIEVSTENEKLMGNWSLARKCPGRLGLYLFQINTTVGTGSESTLGGCSQGTSITLKYHDALPYQTVASFVQVIKEIFVTANPQPIGLNEVLRITVSDYNLNVDSLKVEQSTIHIESSRPDQGSIVLDLFETDKNSGVFTGAILTFLSSQYSGRGENKINVLPGDILYLVYEAAFPLVNLQSKLYVYEVLVGTIGAVSATSVLYNSVHGSYSGSDTLLAISVIDRDLNLQEFSKWAVTVTTSKDNEYEIVSLTPQAINPNVFTGNLRTCTRCYMGDCNLDFFSYEKVSNVNVGSGLVLPEGSIVLSDGTVVPPLTSPGLSPLQTSMILRCSSEVEGTSNDGVMFVEPGDLLTVTYTDEMPLGIHQVFTHIARAGLLQIHPMRELICGNPLYLNLLDGDLNNDPWKSEVAYIIVETDQVGVSGSTVKLIEDGVNTGLFTGLLQTVQWIDCSFGCDPETANLMSNFHEGIIVVSPGGLLHVIYNSLSTGETQILSVNIASIGNIVTCPINDSGSCLNHRFDTFRNGVTVSLAVPGNRIAVTVTDLDLFSDLSDITVMAYPEPNQAGDYESVMMTWSGVGQFTGILPTISNDSATPNDGLLVVSENSEVTFSYLDSSPSISSLSIVRMAMTGVLAQQMMLVDDIPTLVVKLVDNDLLMNISMAERAVITLKSQRYGNNSIFLSLLESNATNNIFEGGIAMQSSLGVESFLGESFWGHSGDLITVTYNDLIPPAVIESKMVLRFPGVLRVPIPYIPVNSYLTITLIDGDLDSNNTAAEGSQIQIVGAVRISYGSILNIDVTRTSHSPGTFTATLFLTDHAVSNVNFGLNIPVISVSLGTYLTFQYADSAPQFVTQKISQVAYLGELSMILTSENGMTALKITLIDLDFVFPAVVTLFTTQYSDKAGLQLNLQQNIFTPGSFYVFLPLVRNFKLGIYTIANSSIALFGGDTIFVRYIDQKPASSILFFANVPMLEFITPSPSSSQQFTVYEDCPFQLLLVASDIRPALHRLNGSSISIYPSRYKIEGSDFLAGLLPGCMFSLKSYSYDNSTGLFTWMPRTDQQGKKVELCFGVTDSLGIILPNNSSEYERCFVVEVAKCKKCVLSGESLAQVAVRYSTDWRILWSLNLELKDPENIQEGMLLNISILYSIQNLDTLVALSQRFKTTVKTLLALNPEIPDSLQVLDRGKLCIIPDTSALDSCSPPAKSSTWEPLDEQYVPPDYFDNPYNWESIDWTDPRGQPTKSPNPKYPQRPTAD